MIKEYIQKFWIEFIYIPISICFMFHLNALNKVLLANGLNETPFKLLIYDDYKPIQFFAGTIFLAVVGICNGVSKYRSIKNRRLDLDEMIAYVIIIFIMFIIIGILFWLINNPILKAIIFVMFIGGVIVAFD